MFDFGSTSNIHVFEIDAENANNSDDEEEKTQERLAKRFAKRARMQRLEESHAESEEFSQQRLIDEDETMKLELKKMKVGSSFCLLHLCSFIATVLTHMLIFSEWPSSKEKRFLGFQKLLLFQKRLPLSPPNSACLLLSPPLPRSCPRLCLRPSRESA